MGFEGLPNCPIGPYAIATTRMADPTIAPNTPPTDSDVIPILPCSLPRTRRVPTDRPCTRPILPLVSSLQKALQPLMDLAGGGLPIMQLPDGLNNLSHDALDALELLFKPGIHRPILEHIPPGSNRGDSQRSADERVWRP